MGLGGIHIWHLLILFGIVLLIFGTKRLRQLGGDLGGMIKGFREGVKDAEAVAPEVRAAIEDVRRLHQTGARFDGVQRVRHDDTD